MAFYNKLSIADIIIVLTDNKSHRIMFVKYYAHMCPNSFVNCSFRMIVISGKTFFRDPHTYFYNCRLFFNLTFACCFLFITCVFFVSFVVICGQWSVVTLIGYLQKFNKGKGNRFCQYLVISRCSPSSFSMPN